MKNLKFTFLIFCFLAFIASQSQTPVSVCVNNDTTLLTKIDKMASHDAELGILALMAIFDSISTKPSNFIVSNKDTLLNYLNRIIINYAKTKDNSTNTDTLNNYLNSTSALYYDYLSSHNDSINGFFLTCIDSLYESQKISIVGKNILTELNNILTNTNVPSLNMSNFINTNSSVLSLNINNFQSQISSVNMLIVSTENDYKNKTGITNHTELYHILRILYSAKYTVNFTFQNYSKLYQLGLISNQPPYSCVFVCPCDATYMSAQLDNKLTYDRRMTDAQLAFTSTIAIAFAAKSFWGALAACSAYSLAKSTITTEYNDTSTKNKQTYEDCYNTYCRGH